MNIEKEIEKRKQCLFRSNSRCGIGTLLNTHVYDNNIQNHDFVISWMLRCRGTLYEQGHTYAIHDECVSLRRPDRDYRMELSVSDGLRLYLNFPQQVYPALLWMIPELETIEPVLEQPWNDALIREFFAIYDRIAVLASNEMHTVFPQIVQYILRLTGIQQMRASNPLRQAKLLLEENNNLPLPEIASRCGMNYNTFRRSFTQTFDIPPHQYRINHRIMLAKHLLESGLSVSDTAEQLGYPDIYSFTHQFTSASGISPTQFRSSRKHTAILSDHKSDITATGKEKTADPSDKVPGGDLPGETHEP
ncbi:MAG: helix-turn-helix transcriptional regulator [Clostridia bacterium]|nr:helix-turn-helix transcriptional regulator [Clostridia bacterium]